MKILFDSDSLACDMTNAAQTIEVKRCKSGGGHDM